MQRHLTLEELLTEASWLRTLAGHLVSDASRADDLVQDTWLAALRSPPAPTTPPRPWLARVLRNRASNARRAEQRRARHEGARAEPCEPTTPAQAAEQAETQRLLAEEIVRLPEELRTVVVLRYFRGLDSATIARALEVPAGTVRWRLAKALDELRAALDRRSGGERKAWVALLARVAPTSSAARWTALSGAGLLLVATLFCSVVAAVGVSLWRRSSPAPAHAEPVAAGSSVQGVAVLSAAAPPAALPMQREAGGDIASPPSAHEATGLEIAGVVRIEGQPPQVPLDIFLHTESGGRAVSVDTTELASMRPVPKQRIPIEALGTFAFGGLAEGFRGRLRVPGYRLRDGRSTYAVSAPATELVLEFVPAPALRGTLAGPNGEALGAKLDAFAFFFAGEDQDAAAAGSFFEFADLTTEPGGLFCHETAELGLPLVRGTLVFELEQGYRELDLAPFDPEVGLDLGLVALEPVRALAVRVLDAAGAPIAGAQVRVASRWASTRPSEACDADGRTRLLHAPARPFELRVDALRHATARVAVTTRDELVVTLQRATAVDLHFRARPEVDLSACQVIVRGPEELVTWNSPWYVNWLEGAVRMQLGGSLVPQFDEHWSGEQLHRMLAGGRVVLEGLTPGIPFSFELRDEHGRVLATRTSLLGPREWQELTIDLDP